MKTDKRRGPRAEKYSRYNFDVPKRSLATRCGLCFLDYYPCYKCAQPPSEEASEEEAEEWLARVPSLRSITEEQLRNLNGQA